jgi:hypothetical protein
LPHCRRLRGGASAWRKLVLDGALAELLDTAAYGTLQLRLKSVQVNMPHVVSLGK